MSELDTLQHTLLSDIAAAADEPAIEAVRVSALGKKGSISELLKTLGTMTPEERQQLKGRFHSRWGSCCSSRKAEGAGTRGDADDKPSGSA